MKHQIVVIHGGDSFKTYKEYFSFLKRWRIDFERYRLERHDWKKTLGKALGKKFEVITPTMPNKMNAKYAEWKVWFQKFIPHLTPRTALVGHSLGGLFLARFLSETRFPKKIRAIFLVAAPVSEGDFSMPENLKKFHDQCGKIFLYHSKDDPVVPFADFLKYRKSLPSVTGRMFQNRGHFNQSRFPELVKDIKSVFS